MDELMDLAEAYVGPKVDAIYRRLMDRVQRSRALEARVQRAIGAACVDDSRRKSNTYKDNSSWAVPDGTFDASRAESNDGDATPSYNCSSDNPGPE